MILDGANEGFIIFFNLCFIRIKSNVTDNNAYWAAGPQWQQQASQCLSMDVEH